MELCVPQTKTTPIRFDIGLGRGQRLRNAVKPYCPDAETLHLLINKYGLSTSREDLTLGRIPRATFERCKIAFDRTWRSIGGASYANWDHDDPSERLYAYLIIAQREVTKLRTSALPLQSHHVEIGRPLIPMMLTEFVNNLRAESTYTFEDVVKRLRTECTFCDVVSNELAIVCRETPRMCWAPDLFSNKIQRVLNDDYYRIVRDFYRVARWFESAGALEKIREIRTLPPAPIPDPNGARIKLPLIVLISLAHDLCQDLSATAQQSEKVISYLRLFAQIHPTLPSKVRFSLSNNSWGDTKSIARALSQSDLQQVTKRLGAWPHS
jgi:hypothetical protein